MGVLQAEVGGGVLPAGLDRCAEIGDGLIQISLCGRRLVLGQIRVAAVGEGCCILGLRRIASSKSAGRLVQIAQLPVGQGRE